MSLALSPVETEQLRDLRARLNRVPKGAQGDKSVGPLSRGFFVLAPRVGLAPQAGGPPLGAVADLKANVAEADLTRLRQVVAQLDVLRTDATVWRALFDAGILSAVLTRRLVLGGREQGG
jgi:hypothetical protein